MDDEFEKFLHYTEKIYFPVCRFTKEFLIENERNIRDAMYVASQAIKWGLIEVEKEEYEDGSWNRVFTIRGSVTKGEAMYVNIIKGEYCARTTERCVGEECRDYGENGCKIYFRSSNRKVK